MNNRFFHGLVLTLTAFMLLPGLPALAGPAVAFHASLKGQFAEAYFDRTDPSGCVETFVYIFAVKGIDKETSQPDQAAQASALVFQNDSCSGVPIVTGTGSATLTEAAFQIDEKLSSAKLYTTFEVCDSVSDTWFPVDAHLIWTSSGSPFRLKDHRQIQAAGLKINSRYDGTFREARASGSMTDGTTNLTPQPAFLVDMATVKLGEVDLLR